VQAPESSVFLSLLSGTVKFIQTVLRIALALTVGLASGGVMMAVFVVCFNKPLPPWGWTTNVVLESTLIGCIGLIIWRIFDAPRQIRVGILICTAIAISLAFSRNGAVVHNMLTLTYFLLPTLVAGATAIYCLRFRWPGQICTPDLTRPQNDADQSRGAGVARKDQSSPDFTSASSSRSDGMAPGRLATSEPN